MKDMYLKTAIHTRKLSVVNSISEDQYQFSSDFALYFHSWNLKKEAIDVTKGAAELSQLKYPTSLQLVLLPCHI